MRKPRSITPGSRSAVILQEIVQELDLLATFGYRPVKVLRYGMDGVRRMRAAKERTYRRQEIQRLQRRKLLLITKVANEYRVALTEAGAKEAIRLQVLSAKLMPDTCVCMVVFDIPEYEANLRKMLRAFLRHAGFRMVQKSVWVSPYDAWEPLARLFAVSKSSQWISVYVARKMDLRT